MLAIWLALGVTPTFPDHALAAPLRSDVSVTLAVAVPAKAAPSTASHSAVAGLPPPTVDAAGQLAASLLARMAATSRTTSGAAAGARPREGAVAPAATSSAEAQR